MFRRHRIIKLDGENDDYFAGASIFDGKGFISQDHPWIVNVSCLHTYVLGLQCSPLRYRGGNINCDVTLWLGYPSDKCQRFLNLLVYMLCIMARERLQEN